MADRRTMQRWAEPAMHLRNRRSQLFARVQKLLLQSVEMIMWVAIGSMALVGLASSIVGMFIMPLPSLLAGVSYGTSSDVSKVSGFYGPGAFLSWLLSASYTAGMYVAEGYRATEHHPKVKPDMAAFIAMFAFSAVAAIDALIRLFHGNLSGEDAQLDAALVICRFTILFSAAALLTRSERSRGIWHWRAFFFVSLLPAVSAELLLCTAAIHVGRVLIPLSLLATSFMKTQFNRITCSFLIYCLTMPWLGLAFMSSEGVSDGWNVYCHYTNDPHKPLTFTYPWPLSSAAWSDLDQMATLAGASVGLMYISAQKIDWLKRWMRKLKFWDHQQ